jgi:hypothetical protein
MTTIQTVTVTRMISNLSKDVGTKTAGLSEKINSQRL